MHNSYLMSQLADQHVSDLRRSVARDRVASGEFSPRAHRPSRARCRAGWALVTVGLRLAVGRPAGAL